MTGIDAGRLFGRGISFPPRIGGDGRWVTSEGPQNVRESIRVILLTEMEERLMLPRFGAGLKRYLFRPNNTATHRLITEAVEQSLGRWEPRVRVQSVRVDADARDPDAALVTLRYRLVANRSEEELQLRVQLAV